MKVPPCVQTGISGRAGLQFQRDRSFAHFHRPVRQHPHLRRGSQLPQPASPRGECARGALRNVRSAVAASPRRLTALPSFRRFTDGQLEERDRAVPPLQQAGVFARGDGGHAEAQGHQSQQQQVSPHGRFSILEVKLKGG